MTVDNFRNFRNNLFDLFTYRSDSIMDFIDAIAGQTSKEKGVRPEILQFHIRTFASLVQMSECRPDPFIKRDQTGS